jgi:hypothetical protein
MIFNTRQNQWAADNGCSRIVRLYSVSRLFIKFRIFGPLVNVNILTLFQGGLLGVNEVLTFCLSFFQGLYAQLWPIAWGGWVCFVENRDCGICHFDNDIHIKLVNLKDSK